MIDRIGELLAEPAEEDEEKQEDVLALPVTEEAVPAFPRRDEGEVGEVGTDDNRSGGRAAEEIVSERPGLVAGEGGTRGRSGERAAKKRGAVARSGRTAGETALERSGLIAGEIRGDRSGGRTAGEILLERPGVMTGETETESAQAVEGFWKAGPVWTVRSVEPETDGTRRTESVGRTVRVEEVLPQTRVGDSALTGLERAARDGAAGLSPDGAGRSGTARAGLEGLYRQTVGGLRPAASALPPVQAGRTARAQEPVGAAPLDVDELDRAVRRDSRRYDGGMNIY